MTTTRTVEERARDMDELIEAMDPPEMMGNMLPKMMKMVPPLMMMGFLVLLVGLGLGVYGSTLVDNAINPGASPPVEVTEDFETAQVLAAWLPSFEFLGMGLILFSISITLLGIATALRKMGANVVGLIIKYESARAD